MKRSKHFGLCKMTPVMGAMVVFTLSGCNTDKGLDTRASMQNCAAMTGPGAAPSSSRNDIAAPYFGCSNYANLRAMLDNPTDIDKGRPLGPANGARESVAVQRYQEGKSKAFGQSTPTTSTTLLTNAITAGATQ